jgi:hypothetical protein
MPLTAKEIFCYDSEGRYEVMKGLGVISGGQDNICMGVHKTSISLCKEVTDLWLWAPRIKYKFEES